MDRLLTTEEIGNLEWDSTDLEMFCYDQFAEAHPKEAKAILEAQAGLTTSIVVGEIFAELDKLDVARYVDVSQYNKLQGEYRNLKAKYLGKSKEV